MLSTILIVILVPLLVGALPSWPYSSGWGYAPGRVPGLTLAIVVGLALLGRVSAAKWKGVNGNAVSKT